MRRVIGIDIHRTFGEVSTVGLPTRDAIATCAFLWSTTSAARPA